MFFKPGVRQQGMKVELLVALVVADQVYLQLTGNECTITSLADGKHSRTSLHYAGYAGDLRVRDVKKNLWKKLTREIKTRLGENYDVILEAAKIHIHIEYQPRFMEKY